MEIKQPEIVSQTTATKPPKPKRRYKLFIFLIIVILAGSGYFYYQFSTQEQRLTDIKTVNENLISENGNLRAFVFGSCQLNAFSKDYFFADGQDCAYFFPELTGGAEENISVEGSLIDFVNVFYVDKNNEDLKNEIWLLQDYSEGKTVTAKADQNSVFDELKKVSANQQVAKYLKDYNLSLEQTSATLFTLKKDNKEQVEITYLKASNILQAKFISTKKILRLDNFSGIKSRAQYTLEEFSDFDYEKAFAALDKSKLDVEGLENYLILGKNEKNVDTIILATVNNAKKQITLVSVPRDLWVNAKKINSFYYFYGMSGFIRELEKLLGVKIKNYILIDMDAFPEVVDKVGGIDYTFREPLIDPTYRTVDKGVEGTLYFPKGTTHLNGIQALRVSRTRHTSSDFARADRQQQVLKALASEN